MKRHIKRSPGERIMKKRSLSAAVLAILLLLPATGWSKGGHSGGRASSSHSSSRTSAGGKSRGSSARASASRYGSASSRFRSTSPPSKRRSTGGSATSAAPPPSTTHRHRPSSTTTADAAGQRSGTGRGYVNSRGHWVPSPTRTADGKAPRGAAARCGDGSFSFSQSHRGTCSHHGGVTAWLH